jgi:DNA-binding winged helix-turn-helix (wHTH) protein/Tol biopolymer transport system component
VAKNIKLKLGNCEYDPDSRVISSEDNAPQAIGHVQAKLLQLLYSNPKIYFSNEDLQKEVWDGRVIENTTIRTTVSYLRKALGESEECKYIDSGRNKGYRFVADIEEITPQRQIKKIFPFLVIATLTLVLVYIALQTTTPVLETKTESTLLGQEIEASVSGGLMVFSHRPEGSQFWNLYSKQIGKERYNRLTEGAFNDRNAALNSNGSKLAFNRYQGASCQIIIASFTSHGQALENQRLAFNCPDNLLVASIAWKDDENLYLSYSNSISNTYAVYLFNIQSGDSVVITSPPSSGRGDYFISANHADNKIAYLRNIIGNKTEVWVYDEGQKKSNKIASIPLILMSVGWLDSQRLVLRTGYGELSSLDIENSKLTTLYQTDSAISFPYVIDKNNIGFMKGFLAVRDIVRFKLDGTYDNVVTSSFRDNSPVYAEKTGEIAFISNRSGENQIWLLKPDGELTQVTQFESNLRIGNLAISHDGLFVAFVINAHLKIMGTDGQLKFKSKEKHLYQNPVFSANSDKVYYTSNVDGEWYIESRLMANFDEINRITQGYVVKPCIVGSCFYFIKNNESVLFKSENGAFESTGVELNNIAKPDQLAIFDDYIYYLRREGSQSVLLRQNMSTKSITNLMTLSASRFSIQQSPFGVLTSVSRKPETLLQSITIKN